MITYGKRTGLRFRVPHLLASPKSLLGSFTNRETNTDVTCIMAILNEQRYIKHAIKSSMGFVSRYIIVDKNGETKKEVTEVIDRYSLDVDYHVRDLNYAKSKQYGIEQADGAWIMFQDGDELLNPSVDLTRFLGFKNTYLRTRKNIITEDLKTPIINNGYHSFIFHNNGTIHIPNRINQKNRPVDTPVMDGRGIHLSPIALFNISEGDLIKQIMVPYDEKIQGLIPKIVHNALVDCFE